MTSANPTLAPTATLSPQRVLVLGLLVLGLVAPFGIYPIFLMKGFCFALFAAASAWEP